MSKVTDFIKQHLVPVIISIAVAVVIALGFIVFRQHNTITLTKTQLNYLTDTLVKTRNRLGQEVASHQAASGDLKTTQALLKAAKADPALQQIAKNKSNVVGITHSTETRTDTSVVIPYSDRSIDSLDEPKSAGIPSSADSAKAKVIYENFVRTISDPWYTETITKKDDSLKLDLVTKSKYAYQFNKSGDKYTLSVTNLNPHEETKDLQSFYVTPPPAKNGKWFFIGGGVGAGVMLVLIHLLTK